MSWNLLRTGRAYSFVGSISRTASFTGVFYNNTQGGYIILRSFTAYDDEIFNVNVAFNEEFEYQARWIRESDNSILHSCTIGATAIKNKSFREDYSMPATAARVDLYSRKKEPVNGKLKDQAPGTIVNFAGSPWTILEPETGYSFKNESIGKRPFSTVRGMFSTTVSGNIGHYLNNEYIEMFSDVQKSVIKPKSWGVYHILVSETGTEYSTDQIKSREDLELVSGRVGMLSISEWKKYSKRYNSADGILGNLSSGFVWLRNQYGNNFAHSWGLDNVGGLFSASQTATTHDVHPTLYIDPETNIVDGTVVHNAIPSITVNTANNQTLYENDTFLINGTAHEPDLGDIVNVWYQINSGTARAIATQINTGNPVGFSEQLTFKAGKLHLPNGNALTGALADGVAHKLKVWAEDNKGGKSTIAERTFYVVPNRAPSLTIDPFESLADLIDADRVTLSGDSFDLDGNDVIVRYRINNGINTEIYSGPAGPWSFDFPLSKLVDGENTIVVEVVDTFDFKYSLTKKLYRSADLTPLAKSVYRGTIDPPAGSAQGVLLWIKRDESQDVSIEISMTNGTEPENFVPMDFDSSGPDEIGTVEDFFRYRADAPAEKIAIKLSWTGDKPIHQIQGALTQ